MRVRDNGVTMHNPWLFDEVALTCEMRIICQASRLKVGSMQVCESGLTVS